MPLENLIRLLYWGEVMSVGLLLFYFEISLNLSISKRDPVSFKVEESKLWGVNGNPFWSGELCSTDYANGFFLLFYISIFKISYFYKWTIVSHVKCSAQAKLSLTANWLISHVFVFVILKKLHNQPSVVLPLLDSNAHHLILNFNKIVKKSI
jgi:hypothetical protein